MRLHPIVILPLLLAASSVAWAQESYSAKSLFFGEDNDVVAVSTAGKTGDKASTAVAASTGAKPASLKVAQKKPASRSIGASYFIRLRNQDGTERDVLASRKFKSGERFQLGVKINKPGHVLVFNEDANGKVTQIYPQAGRDNFVNAMGVVFLPAKGAFEFDQEPGVEHLLVYVSQEPVPVNLPDRIRTMQPDLVTTSSPMPAPSTVASCDAPTPALDAAAQVEGTNERVVYASKAIKLTDDAACASAAPEGALFASKAIVFSDDADSGGMQAASYVVKKVTTPDANLFLKIRLLHE
jgi:hypothetical protein